MNVLHTIPLETLKKNKSRTLITIIGILLSTAMLTAVTTIALSFRDLYVQDYVYARGDWHVQAQNISQPQLDGLSSSLATNSVTSAQQLGYAKSNLTITPDTPYFYLLGIDSSFADMMSIHVDEGEYPANQQQLLLPLHLKENYSVGDTLTLDIGVRTLDGMELWQTDSFRENETLSVNRTQTYTISGFYRIDLFFRNEFQHSPAGYTALTLQDDSLSSLPKTAYFSLKSPRSDIEKLKSQLLDTTGISEGNVFYNTPLLKANGFFSRQATTTIVGFLIIITLLIMGSSIAFIYTSFSMSVSERTKQFGLLSSIGATKKQIYKMVLFESMIISVIGIPLGILCGLIGIKITFFFIGQSITSILSGYSQNEIALRVCISPLSIAITILLSLVTVLLSAWIPSKRATKVSAIQSIRQSQDIVISKKEKSTPALVKKMFGISGILAQKYYQRNRKKYRTTIFSLSVSVVLFITAWSFIDCVQYMFRLDQQASKFDLSFFYNPVDNLPSEDLLNKILQLDSVDDAIYVQNESYNTDAQGRSLWVNLVPQKEWDRLLSEHHLNPEIYNDPSHPVAIAVDGKIFYDSEKEKYVENHLLTESSFDTNLSVPQGTIPVQVGTVVDDDLYYLQMGDSFSPAYGLIYPIGTAESLFPDKSSTFKIITPNADQALQEISSIIEESELLAGIYNQQADTQEQNQIILILKVFAIGFIVLIGLIAVANVFSTVSTNIQLRQRDFAMLKTIGMSQKDFHRMLWYEVLLYAIKALIYGILTSFVLIFILNYLISLLVSTSLKIPYIAISLAFFGVFALIASTMFYSVKKIKKQNLVELLRNENL